MGNRPPSCYSFCTATEMAQSSSRHSCLSASLWDTLLLICDPDFKGLYR